MEKAISIKLNPKVTLYIICDCWEFDFEPIKKFCEKNKVIVQGIINASQTRAIWNYYNRKYDNMKLGIYIPIDIRRLKNTKNKIKN